MQCGVVGKGVLVHRLLAVSEYGYEEVCDTVRQINGWNNQPFYSAEPNTMMYCRHG